jgi:hypothetical protein
MRAAGHVARMKTEKCIKIVVEFLEDEIRLGDFD